MPWLNKVRHSTFFIKLTHWEYWPFGIVQFPLFLYYPYLSLKARSFTFFTASNPGIEMGGMFGESKFKVLELVPAEYKPRTVLIRAGASLDELEGVLQRGNLVYPLIFKPDIGERGFMVRKVSNTLEAATYLLEMKHDFLVQELVDLPLEFGVFYSRIPGEENGLVTSIVMKEMLTVVGDGVSTLRELILQNDRAKLQWPVLQKKFRGELENILQHGVSLEIVSIGNHCLGTKFINANHLIDEKVNETFDRISKSISGFYFGRYDLRCGSINDLRAGRVSVLELNGCGAEPAHIYDPSFSFWKAVGVLLTHWKTIFTIADLNRKAGVRYLPLKEAVHHYRSFKEKTGVK